MKCYSCKGQMFEVLGEGWYCDSCGCSTARGTTPQEAFDAMVKPSGHWSDAMRYFVDSMKKHATIPDDPNSPWLKRTKK